MSSKSTTAKPPMQLPTLGRMEFGQPGLAGESLFCICEGAALVDGLDFAADMAEGVNQLGSRLADTINEGELVYLAEVRAIAFLGEVAAAVTRASQYALRKMEEQP